MTNHKRIVILGGGIAGTTTAIFLKRAGFNPVIYEASPGPRDEEGSFLGITPNGQDVLKTLGIHNQVLADGFLTHGFHFSNHKGNSLGIVPSNTITIKRGQLTKGMLEEVIRQGIQMNYGKRLVNIEMTDENTATAHFQDGTYAEGNVLVGCDGVHSRTRQVIFPDAPNPEYTGMLSFGAISKNDIGLPVSKQTVEMIFGQKAFFSYLVRPDGLIYWFGNVNQKKEPGRGELDEIADEQWKQKLLELYAGDIPIITEIMRNTNDKIARYPVYDIQTIPNWHKGVVCIIGDAAHAPSPSAGQGASLALEDGIVIAKCLRDIQDTEQALATFVSLRKERAEKLVQQSRLNSSGKSPSNPLSRFMRDLLLPIFLKRGGDATKWMYSYHVDWDEKILAKAQKTGVP